MNFISANSARENALRCLEILHDDTLGDINKRIRIAASRGMGEIKVNDNLLPSVVTFLKMKGYMI